MATQVELQAVITAKDEASGVLGGLSKSIDANKASLLALGGIAASVFGATVAFAKSSIDAANEAAGVQAQLNAVLTSTKGAAGVTAQAAIDLSKALEKTTTFSDEAVLSTENLLLTFTSIGKDVMPGATTAVLNMSQALGEDTKSAAIQLGKALQDPVNGITALRRVGVNFTDDQKQVIQSLVDTGQSAKAQQLILAELDKEFGGSAAAAADTFAGKQAQLANQMNDVQETIGNALIPVLADLTAKLVPIITKVGEWIEKHPTIVKWIIILTAGISGLILVLIAVAGAVALVNLAMSPITLIILAVVAAIAVLSIAAYEIVTHWQTIKDFFKGLWEDVKGIFSSAITAIIAFFQPLINVVQTLVNAISSVGSGIANVASKVGGAVSSAVKSVIPHAAGGSVNPYSTYLVGENGPELFTSAVGGTIMPNSQLAGGGGQNINITISGAVFSADAAKTLGDVIMKQLRMKTRVGV